MLGLAHHLSRQFDSERRFLYFYRIFVVLLTLVLVTEPYSYYISELESLLPLSPYPLATGVIIAWKVLIALFAAGLLFFKASRKLQVTFSLLTTAYLLNYHFNTTNLLDQRYNYLAHLVLGQIIFFVPNKTSARSAFLAFAQAYILLIYFQAFLSKALATNFTWFTNPDVLKHYLLMIGTSWGEIVSMSRSVLILFTSVTLIFEALGWLLFIWSKKSYGICAMIFHLCVQVFLGISFWHLFPLYLPLFVMDRQASHPKES